MRTVGFCAVTAALVVIMLCTTEVPVAAARDWSPEPDMSGDPEIDGFPDNELVRINDEVDLSCAWVDDDDAWEDEEEEEEGEDGDLITYTWECTAGTWKNGENTGVTVTWIAPATPSEAVGDVTFTVTASDAAEIPSGDTGDRDDDPNPSHSELVTVWNATITKCDAYWYPTYGGTTNFTCTIYPSALTRKIRFLLGSSSEDGRCCNFGTESDDDPDLKFPDQTGFTIDGEPEAELRNWATTTSQVSSAMVTVQAYDYGAYGSISADIILEEEPVEETESAYVVGEGTETSTTVPVEEDEPANHIADVWPWNAGGATDDSESNPAGDGTNGDGFSRYEEYRGFMVNGTHTRTNPDGEKDIFVCDEDGLANEDVDDFSALGLKIHKLAADGSEYGGSRVVNFKWDTAHNLPSQCGIRMYEGPYHQTAYGECEPSRGIPNDVLWVAIYTPSIREDGPPTHNQTTWDPADQGCLLRVIGHELGHAVNIEQHEPGTENCIMHDVDWNDIAHDYCTTEDDCQHAWKLR